MSIVVIGSINTDLTIQVPHFATRNETVLGNGDFRTTQGGKGANQAVAAAAGGLSVHMTGKVGEDAFGDEAIKDLLSAGVSCDHVGRESDHSTGIAAIFVDPEGNNSITVAPGANACFLPADVRAAESVIAEAAIVMLQLEIPIPAVTEAIRIANHHGTPVMLDPAPASAKLPPLDGVDYLTPNEIEAEMITGISPFSEKGPAKIAQVFRDRGVKHVVLTLGEKGCFIADQNSEAELPARPIEAVDSTGAGDTFNGFLATAITKGLSFEEAAEIACAAASLSVTRPGARLDLPGWDQVQAYMRNS